MGNWVQDVLGEIKLPEQTEENQAEVQQTAEQTTQTNNKPTEPDVAKEQGQDEKRVISAGGLSFEFEPPKPEEPETGITDTQKFFDMIEQKHGIKVNNLDDVFGFVEKAKQVDELVKTNDEYKTKESFMQEFFSTLPPEIAVVIRDYSEGKDYRATMQQLIAPQNDYSRDVKSFSKEELIQLYNPDMTKEDIEDLEETALNKIYRASTMLYEADKKDWSRSRKEQEDVAKTIAEQQKSIANNVFTSITGSIDQLKTAFPKVDNDALKAVESTMRKGFGGILVDENRMYKPEAAKMIFFALKGEEIMNALTEELKQQYQRKINKKESEVKEQIVGQYTNDKPKAQSHSITSATIDEAVQATLPPAFGGKKP